MHDEMGVFLELGRHPFDVRGLRDGRKRSGDNLSIFIRPTIPYSLTCDGDKSRKNFLEKVGRLSVKTTGDYGSMANVTFILGCVAIGFACCCTIPTLIKGFKATDDGDGGHKVAMLCPVICGFCVPMGLVIAMIFTSKFAA
jgi:hypothetical protein